LIDYHLHSERSHDASGSVIDTCRAALELGLAEICFTEHVDFEPSDPCYGYFDYDLCRRQVEDAREAFAGKIDVRFGAEFDFQVKYASQIRDALEGTDFDYVTGAVHYIDGILLERHADYFPGKTAEQAYRPYFETSIALARTGLFDALAHMDLCKRHGVRYFGKFDPALFSGLMDETLAAVIENGMSLEVNSSGLRQTVRETYPGRLILDRYYALGGRNVTVGSDSHSLDNVGYGIREALELVKSVGFGEISTYRERARSGRAI